MRWRLWPGRHELSEEERAATEAARLSREAAQRDRAVAADVLRDNRLALAEIGLLRADNHLTTYIFDAALQSQRRRA